MKTCNNPSWIRRSGFLVIGLFLSVTVSVDGAISPAASQVLETKQVVRKVGQYGGKIFCSPRLPRVASCRAYTVPSGNAVCGTAIVEKRNGVQGCEIGCGNMRAEVICAGITDGLDRRRRRYDDGYNDGDAYAGRSRYKLLTKQISFVADGRDKACPRETPSLLSCQAFKIPSGSNVCGTAVVELPGGRQACRAGCRNFSVKMICGGIVRRNRSRRFRREGFN